MVRKPDEQRRKSGARQRDDLVPGGQKGRIDVALVIAAFHQLVGVDGEPEEAGADPSDGHGAASLRHIARKRQKDKAQRGKDEAEQKPVFCVQPVLRGNRTIDAKADHDAGKSSHCGNYIELHAIEHLIDVNLRERADGPADKTIDPKQENQRAQLRSHRPEMCQGKHRKTPQAQANSPGRHSARACEKIAEPAETHAIRAAAPYPRRRGPILVRPAGNPDPFAAGADRISCG